VHKRETSNALYTLVQSEHKRFQMLSKCISANSRIAQVVRQGILHKSTSLEEVCWALVRSRQRGTTRQINIPTQIQ